MTTTKSAALAEIPVGRVLQEYLMDPANGWEPDVVPGILGSALATPYIRFTHRRAPNLCVDVHATGSVTLTHFRPDWWRVQFEGPSLRHPVPVNVVLGAIEAAIREYEQEGGPR